MRPAETRYVDSRYRVPTAETEAGAVATAIPASRASLVPAQRIIALQTPVELGSNHGHDHHIELQRDGDRIVAIHVFCRCGEQISLECDLED